ncbi:hypothetical protein [Blastococcus xanthinilyticus]|uniref:Uncharacterized protein n=1 Tax=Blastococcus xanthinilyticus TaxID=1564164 RepID=A0A5S5CV55_9ACTN|nr:hypothetical protein [Blastococcus xanthinilyticus]TYP86868.1 hypothetical protein BD833_108153 [Blastococcus xanthinilyticus]
MATAGDEQRLQDLQASVIDALTGRLASRLAGQPELADVIASAVESRFEALDSADSDGHPVDPGLNALIGFGAEAPPVIDRIPLPRGVQPYDEQVTSERITGIADLYYLYQHERIGVFRVVQKLKELFDAGSVRLSAGEGATGLYRFDRRDVLRYTERDRRAAYLRAFGYGRGPLAPGARRNGDFHPLFVTFNDQVAQFWRDRRISEVMRDRAQDPSFGSIAIVRRAGLDLRNNLKFTSYGNVAVMRIEVMQLLDEAFRIVGAEDVKRLFGADNAWDVIEEVLTRYFGITPVTSPRQRMAVTGRRILRWLGQQFVLEESRPQFEAKLKLIADDAEEWRTSAQSIGIVAADPGRRVTLRPSPAVPAPSPARPPRQPAARFM